MQRLRCGVQKYAWGKLGRDSAVAQFQLQGDESNVAGPRFVLSDASPYAELWLGTHPSLPTTLWESDRPLEEYLRQAPDVLGEAHRTAFGCDLPYILKLLSVNTALSIQAHPDKKLAERLHAADPAHYPDDNHKPELVVALSDPFLALCCFRPLREVAAFLRELPELSLLVSEDEARLDIVENLHSVASQEAPAAEAAQDALRAVFGQILLSKPAVVATHMQALERHLRESLFSDLPLAHRTFLRLVDQYPGDSGCFLAYVLNVLELHSGEGLFLPANEPHAYVFGDCIEVMAKSDNVVRAGLTPKFKDVDTLLAMLTYSSATLASARFPPNRSGEAVTTYAPPVPEFQLHQVHLDRHAKRCDARVSLSASASLLVVAGRGLLTITTDERRQLPVSSGMAFLLPANALVAFQLEPNTKEGQREDCLLAFLAEPQLERLNAN
eukprot:TRINITY_DN13625_c0_g1_i1.p1 TRINITY_DN13625_c0_g1~~TRINITY_DN13625_c0_g1_i1.p1  ORF type:complete len:441 (+),score=84.90 TRINITY_DN13625_c0_g1_i1:86-1408(+)